MLKQLNIFFEHVESMTFVSCSALYWMFVAPFREKGWRMDHVFYQMVFVGVRSLLIVAAVNAFMGAIMAMQTAYLLKQFGAIMYTGSLVAVSFAREIAPLLTALILSGRVGAAMTAELGTMQVSEEIDALDVMGIHPIRFLLVPRLLAVLVMVPCLTVIADVMGILGGYLIGVFYLHLDGALYLDKSLDILVYKDLYTGLIKSVFFGFIIGLVGCYFGLIVRGGAEGVGRSTMIAVVSSMLLIIGADCFFTALFYFSF